MLGDSQLVFSGGLSESSCASVTIRDDDLFEGEEMHCLTLQSSDPDIIVGSTFLTYVVIADNDRKLCYSSCWVVITFPFEFSALRIGFQQSDYPITEGSPVEVCVEILEGSSAVPITLTVNATEGTAEGIVKPSQGIPFNVPLYLPSAF